MSMTSPLMSLYRNFYLWRLRKAGLTIPNDCTLMRPFPYFGDEPYLVTIGHNVGFAGEVFFITHDGGTRVFKQQERYKKVLKYGRITIYDNCVIGQRVILLPGVSVGPNSVIAAGSVVSRNVPPGVLAAGNPAKPVMTTHQYAEWSLAATPDYDEESYRKDKRTFLIKFQMRGSAAKPVNTRDDTAADSTSK